LTATLSKTVTTGTAQFNLSLLGFGAAPIGNLYQSVTDDEAQLTVLSALESGVSYFDTAPHYGFGLSESRLGAALKDASPSLVISTKVGRVLVPTQSTEILRYGFVNAPALEPVFDYSYDGVMLSFEESLRRLQRDRVDILFAHDLGSVTHGAKHPKLFEEFMQGGYRAMLELKKSGKVSAIGLGANEWQVCEEALTAGDFDIFLLAGRYTLLEQTACDSFFPICAKRNIKVILGGPFNSGILATGVKHHSGPHYYNYESAPAGIIDRVAKIESICENFSVPLAAAALQFPAAHPQICSVLAGLANPAQVRNAVELMAFRIPGEFWIEMQRQQLLHPEAPVL
jgi:D-threo-aldose 1-dehydrogenase